MYPSVDRRRRTMPPRKGKAPTSIQSFVVSYRQSNRDSALWSTFFQNTKACAYALDLPRERTIWIVDANGLRKAFRCACRGKPEYSESVAKGETARSRSHSATSTCWLQCLSQVIYEAFSCNTHHRIVSSDNEFTVKRQR